MDSGCSRHMTRHKTWFSSLTSLSHKEYMTFGDKVLGTGIIKVNDHFTLNDVALNDHFTLNDVTLVHKLRYNLLSISAYRC
jgi:hypothetical protein